MLHEVVRFSAGEWARGSHPLERRMAAALGGASVLEFAPGFRDPRWCANGHAGIVLAGTLGLEFADGNVEVGAGDGFVVRPGTRHRAYNPGDLPVRLFIAARPGSP